MYRTLLGILGVFAGVLALVGFTFSKSTEGPADFRLLNLSEPRTLDPSLMTGEPEGRFAYELYEGVVRKDAKTMQPVPGVAESWQISPDGKTYTFRLRENARWSDGRPVTAHDFVYSWKRLLDPKLASEYAYIAFPIRYAEAFSTFDGLADSIDKKILPALDRLKTANPGGAPVKAWRTFTMENAVQDPLRHESDAQIAALFSRHAGTVSAAELDHLAKALERARVRLWSDGHEARRRLGVDAGFFAKDAHTLVLELNAPTPYFLKVLAFYPMFPTPRWVVEKRPDDWYLPETFVGNGPFRLKSWVVGDRARLERSETYWGRHDVKLRTVELLAIESESAALNVYLTGGLDWLAKQLPRDLIPEFKKRKDFYTIPANAVYFYRINTTRKPFDDPRVRQALSMAFDRRTIVESVLGGGELPAYTLVPPVLTDYASPSTELRYDVEKARALLAEAGYPEGKGFPKFGILYNTFETHKKIADVIADQLKRNLGIDARAYNQEWGAYLAAQQTLDYEIARAGWIGDYEDPNTFLDMWVTNGGQNRTGWSSARYDELIRLAGDVTPFVERPEPVLARLREVEPMRALLGAARSASTPESKLEEHGKIRMQLLREAEAILFQDAFPIIPVYFYVNVGFVRQNVRGFYQKLELENGKTGWNLQDVHPLRDVWMAGDGAEP
ncbi:MAG TPA: peptide ABC transporter substrate-binding protein [Polyangiaceae bacterium]